MAIAYAASDRLVARGIRPLTDSRGLWNPGMGMFESRQLLTTDPIGTTTVTFSGVAVDSEIRVFLADGTEMAGIESCSLNQQLTWSVYSYGNSNNNVTIRVVNSAYKIIELPYTSSVGSVTIPIQQQKDKWYSNPA